MTKNQHENIDEVVHLVTRFFEGDEEKIMTWFQVANPLLGCSPLDLLALGVDGPRQLREWVEAQIAQNEAPPS